MTSRRKNWPVWLLAAATILFVGFFCSANWFRQVNLVTAQYDMGNMDQVLWHTLHGDWFRMTSPVYGNLEPRTATHADFLLLLYLPAYALFPDPRTPLLLQVLAVASGVIPLFWMGRKRLGAPTASIIAVLYLLFPALEYAVTFDVHAVVLAIPLLLWVWWALTERRWWLYWICIGLLLLAKEEVGLTVAALGCFWVWRRGYRVPSLVTILLGIGWTALMLGWAIPAARHAPGHFAITYYADFGGTYPSILSSVLDHPMQVLRHLWRQENAALLYAVLVPIGVIPLVGLPTLLVSLPEFAVNLLSKNPNQQRIYYQYLSVSIPILFLAAVAGWVRLRRWLAAIAVRFPRWHLQPSVTVGVLLLALYGIWRWSPLPWTQHSADAMRTFSPSPYRQDVAVVRAMLLPSDRVAATNNLVPQFSQRNLIWGFPNALDQADAVIVLEGGTSELLPPKDISAKVRELSHNPGYTLLFRDRLFWYFRKSGTAQQ
ncbi:MAG: DUF2079 domain-containing protein [bacterium]